MINKNHFGFCSLPSGHCLIQMPTEKMFNFKWNHFLFLFLAFNIKICLAQDSSSKPTVYCLFNYDIECNSTCSTYGFNAGHCSKGRCICHGVPQSKQDQLLILSGTSIIASTSETLEETQTPNIHDKESNVAELHHQLQHLGINPMDIVNDTSGHIVLKEDSEKLTIDDSFRRALKEFPILVESLRQLTQSAAKCFTKDTCYMLKHSETFDSELISNSTKASVPLWPKHSPQFNEFLFSTRDPKLVRNPLSQDATKEDSPLESQESEDEAYFLETEGSTRVENHQSPVKSFDSGYKVASSQSFANRTISHQRLRHEEASAVPPHDFDEGVSERNDGAATVTDGLLQKSPLETIASALSDAQRDKVVSDLLQEEPGSSSETESAGFLATESAVTKVSDYQKDPILLEEVPLSDVVDVLLLRSSITDGNVTHQEPNTSISDTFTERSISEDPDNEKESDAVISTVGNSEEDVVSKDLEDSGHQQEPPHSLPHVNEEKLDHQQVSEILIKKSSSSKHDSIQQASDNLSLESSNIREGSASEMDDDLSVSKSTITELNYGEDTDSSLESSVSKDFIRKQNHSFSTSVDNAGLVFSSQEELDLETLDPVSAEQFESEVKDNSGNSTSTKFRQVATVTTTSHKLQTIITKLIFNLNNGSVSETNRSSVHSGSSVSTLKYLIVLLTRRLKEMDSPSDSGDLKVDKDQGLMDDLSAQEIKDLIVLLQKRVEILEKRVHFKGGKHAEGSEGDSESWESYEEVPSDFEFYSDDGLLESVRSSVDVIIRNYIAKQKAAAAAKHMKSVSKRRKIKPKHKHVVHLVVTEPPQN